MTRSTTPNSKFSMLFRCACTRGAPLTARLTSSTSIRSYHFQGRPDNRCARSSSIPPPSSIRWKSALTSAANSTWIAVSCHNRSDMKLRAKAMSGRWPEIFKSLRVRDVRRTTPRRGVSQQFLSHGRLPEVFRLSEGLIPVPRVTVRCVAPDAHGWMEARRVMRCVVVIKTWCIIEPVHTSVQRHAFFVHVLVFVFIGVHGGL